MVIHTYIAIGFFCSDPLRPTTTPPTALKPVSNERSESFLHFHFGSAGSIHPVAGNIDFKFKIGRFFEIFRANSPNPTVIRPTAPNIQPKHSPRSGLQYIKNSPKSIHVVVFPTRLKAEKWPFSGIFGKARAPDHPLCSQNACYVFPPLPITNKRRRLKRARLPVLTRAEHARPSDL